MKYLQIPLAAVLLFSGSCRKPQYPPGNFNAIHTGRVVKIGCGTAIIQFTDGSPYGQNGWTMYTGSSNITLYHVFRVANICTWGGADENSTIRFRLSPPVSEGCILCLVYVPAPDTAYSVEVIR